MNRIYCLFFVLLFLQACGGFKCVEKKAPLAVTPERLELVVDQDTEPYTIPVNFILDIPKGYVPAKARLVYTPRLKAPGNEYTLVPLVITGRNLAKQEERQELLQHQVPDYPDALREVMKREDIQIQFNETIPFQLWMAKAKLVADVKLEACSKSVELYTQTLAPGVVYIPLAPGPVRIKYVTKEIVKKEEGFARFYYPVNGYIVDPALSNNQEQLDDMIRLVQKVKSDTLLHLNKIVITGICSPEGSYLYNENLSRRRAGFIREYLVNHAGIPASQIETKNIAEDWPGLRKLIYSSSVPGMEKVLSILDGPYDDNQKEVLLMRSPQYNYIKQNLFPLLRKVVYEIFYTAKETVEEPQPE